MTRLAIVVAAAALVVTAAAPAPAATVRSDRTTVSAQTFQHTMDKLWEEHVAWTRLAIVEFAAGLPGLPATDARLLRNQTDIGNAIKPYYGAKAGNQLTALLRQHILGAVALLQAAKAGDQAQIAQASAAWYANGNQVADFLSAANRRNWPRSEMRAMMKEHLDQTLKEAQDRLGGNFAADVRDYESIHRHILRMADTLSAGIMRQFPRRFR